MWWFCIILVEESGSEADLIWAQNFEAALRTRQQQRAELVQKRLQEVDSQAKEDLVSLVQAVQSEDRDEDDEEDDPSAVKRDRV